MNGVAWNQLKNSIMSLSNSSSVTYTLGSVEVRQDGRNSPFKAHKGVAFSEALRPSRARTLRVENGKACIVLAENEVYATGEWPAALPGERWDTIVEKIPVQLVEKIIADARQFLPSLEDIFHTGSDSQSPVIAVAFQVRLAAGFVKVDEKMSPVFAFDADGTEWIVEPSTGLVFRSVEDAAKFFGRHTGYPPPMEELE